MRATVEQDPGRVVVAGEQDDHDPMAPGQLGDVRDARSVRDLMDGASVTYHLAALIAIPYSYVAPQSYVDTNVSGTLNVLEAARLHCPRARIFLTGSGVQFVNTGAPISVPVRLVTK